MADLAVSLALGKLWRLYRFSNWDAISDLHSKMSVLADFVNNPRAMMQQRDSINTNLFVDIRKLAYAVEDMVDDLLLEDELKPRRRGYKKLFYIIYTVNPSLLFPLRTQIREFTRKVSDFHLRVEVYERSNNSGRYGLDITRPITPPPPPSVGLVGLDHHVILIRQRVMLAASSQWPPVVTIVGMAGIGKTTLAGLVFESLEIKQNFEVLAWMSLNSDTKRGGRLKMITGSSEHEEVLEEDGLIAKVHHLLQGRHYLIVLDQVEYFTFEFQRLMNEALRPAAVEGSCVLITTRSMYVARRIAYSYSTTPPYELPLLNQEQSRELLQRYMGGGGDWMDVESVHTLLKICGGLPLALNKAGLILHNKIISCKPPGRTYQEILNELEAVPAGNNIIMDELLESGLDAVLVPTSYDDYKDHYLTSCYKRACYLYLASLCKESRIIEASHLIRLWVAEGFIPNDENSSELFRPWVPEGFIRNDDYSVDQTMEDTAQDLLHLLLHFSMIQPVHHHETMDLRRSSSYDFSLTIHPIYHDLCARENNRDNNRFLDTIAGNHRNYSTTLNDFLPHINNPRRLVLYDLSSSAKLIKTHKNFFFDQRVKLRIQDHVLMDTTTDTDNIDVTTLRSLLIPSTKISPPNHLDLQSISWLKFIRVVDLVGVRGLSELPDNIGDTMITLRYLGLRRCSVLTKLPSSVGALPYLQTLDIRETGIQQLPETLGEAAQLRHLLAPDSTIRGVDIDSNRHLHTLAVDDCEGWLLENRLLMRTYNIRSLSLKGLGRLTETQWDELALLLSRLEKMENLYLHAKDPIKISTLSNHLSQLNKLTELYLNGPMTQVLFDGEYCIFPHFDYITVLILDGSKLVSDPMPALGELPSLQHLTLKNDAYIGKEMIFANPPRSSPPIGFPFPRVGFPSLKRLQLWCLRELKGWIMERQTLSNLNFLSIGMCESLGDLPEDLQHLASLREVEVIDPRDEFLDKLRRGWKGWHEITTHALYSIKLAPGSSTMVRPSYGNTVPDTEYVDLYAYLGKKQPSV